MVENDWVKKIENGNIVTRFWYTLKNLHPNALIMCKHSFYNEKRRNSKMQRQFFY